MKKRFWLDDLTPRGRRFLRPNPLERLEKRWRDQDEPLPAYESDATQPYEKISCDLYNLLGAKTMLATLYQRKQADPTFHLYPDCEAYQVFLTRTNLLYYSAVRQVVLENVTAQFARHVNKRSPRPELQCLYELLLAEIPRDSLHLFIR